MSTNRQMDKWTPYVHTNIKSKGNPIICEARDERGEECSVRNRPDVEGKELTRTLTCAMTESLSHRRRDRNGVIRASGGQGGESQRIRGLWREEIWPIT